MERLFVRDASCQLARIMGVLLLVVLYAFVDILGFSIILPLLPYVAETFGASPSMVGLLVSSNAIAQLISAPVIGRLSDNKPLMVICLCATFVSFAMLALATSLTMVFISRVLDGLLGGNISLAQACIADVTTPENRARGMGFVGAAFGIGFIVGPAVGGVLAAQSLTWPALAAAALSALNLVGVLFFFPEPKEVAAQQREKQAENIADLEKPEHQDVVSLLLSVGSGFTDPSLAPILFIRLCSTLIFTVFESTYALYAKHILEMDARDASYLLAYVGLWFSVMQGGGVARLLKRVSERSLLITSFAVSLMACVAWSYSFSLTAALIALFPFSLASGSLNCLITTLVSKFARSGEVGGLLGLSAAIGSLSRIIAPLIGGVLIETFGFASPGFACAALGALATLVCLLVDLEPRKGIILGIVEPDSAK